LTKVCTLESRTCSSELPHRTLSEKQFTEATAATYIGLSSIRWWGVPAATSRDFVDDDQHANATINYIFTLAL